VPNIKRILTGTQVFGVDDAVIPDKISPPILDLFKFRVLGLGQDHIIIELKQEWRVKRMLIHCSQPIFDILNCLEIGGHLGVRKTDINLDGMERSW